MQRMQVQDQRAAHSMCQCLTIFFLHLSSPLPLLPFDLCVICAALYNLELYWCHPLTHLGDNGANRSCIV